MEEFTLSNSAINRMNTLWKPHEMLANDYTKGTLKKNQGTNRVVVHRKKAPQF